MANTKKSSIEKTSSGTNLNFKISEMKLKRN